MDCIDTYYNLVKNTMTSDAEQTDRIWSKASYRLREIIENPGNWVMHYLADGPE